MIKTHNRVHFGERRERREHGESLYIWSGVHHDSIIDGVRKANDVRRIRACDNVVAPDEVEDVEFLSRNDVNEVNMEFVIRGDKKKGGVNVVNDTSKARLK